MKRLKITISLILCIAVMCSLLASCTSKDKRVDFIYPFEGNITSFDPQIASTSDEFLIIENCFEGLVRVLDSGEVRPGVAESWEISSDKLTYTFHLRHGAKWRIKEDSAVTELMGNDFNPDITAKDFVFALQRACDPIMNSPLFSSVSGIVNAAEIHEGRLSTDKLAVTAQDDYTLIIRLKSPDDGFMSTLSTAVGAPCNEEYFLATKGRYGLGLDYTMFNGQFYVSSVLESSYILRNNDMYIGEQASAVTDITLNIINEESNIPENLKNGYYDCAYISGSEYEKLNSDKITVTPYTNKTWAMVLNKNRQLFASKDLRQAVCLGISDADLTDTAYLTKATGITPPSCIIENTTADKAIGNTVPSQNSDEAIRLWRKGLEAERFTSANLTVIVPEGMDDIAKQLVQGIQGSIGSISSYGENGKIAFSLKIDVLAAADFNKRFANGDYDIALYCFSADSHNALTYLEKIISGNYAGENAPAQKALQEAMTVNISELPAACKNVEEEIINDYLIMPVLFESSYYAQAKGVSGVNFHPGSGRVDFVYADRED